MNKRKQIRVISEQIKSSDLPDTLGGFLTDINKVLSDVPATERANVRISLESGWGDESPYLEFEYWRDETDAEMAAREAADDEKSRRAKAMQEAKERETLAALKAKYEP